MRLPTLLVRYRKGISSEELWRMCNEALADTQLISYTLSYGNRKFIGLLLI